MFAVSSQGNRKYVISEQQQQKIKYLKCFLP